MTDTIVKDVSLIQGFNAARIFYIWAWTNYRADSFTSWDASRLYKRSQRTILRYLSVLEDMDMIQRSHRPGNKASFKIIPPN